MELLDLSVLFVDFLLQFAPLSSLEVLLKILELLLPLPISLLLSKLNAILHLGEQSLFVSCVLSRFDLSHVLIPDVLDVLFLLVIESLGLSSPLSG